MLKAVEMEMENRPAHGKQFFDNRMVARVILGTRTQIPRCSWKMKSSHIGFLPFSGSKWRECQIDLHVARQVEGLDGRSCCRPGYAVTYGLALGQEAGIFLN
jgi:hypothetical protein